MIIYRKTVAQKLSRLHKRLKKFRNSESEDRFYPWLLFMYVKASVYVLLGATLEFLLIGGNVFSDTSAYVQLPAATW